MYWLCVLLVKWLNTIWQCFWLVTMLKEWVTTHKTLRGPVIHRKWYSNVYTTALSTTTKIVQAVQDQTSSPHTSAACWPQQFDSSTVRHRHSVSLTSRPAAFISHFKLCTQITYSVVFSLCTHVLKKKIITWCFGLRVSIFLQWQTNTTP